MDAAFARKALSEWYDTGANVRQMHSTQIPPAGKGVLLEHKEGDGEYVKTKVVDANAIRLCDENVYSGYSVGISRPRIDRDTKARGGRIVGGKIVEISLVDRPALPTAKFAVLKSAGTTGKLQFIGKVVLLDEDEETVATPSGILPVRSRALKRVRKGAHVTVHVLNEWGVREALEGIVVTKGTSGILLDQYGYTRDGGMVTLADDTIERVYKGYVPLDVITKAAHVGVHDDFDRDIKNDSTRDLQSALRRIALWNRTDTIPAGLDHDDISKMYTAYSAEIRERNPGLDPGPMAANTGKGRIGLCPSLTKVLEIVQKYSPDQERDDHGRFAGGGGGEDQSKQPKSETVEHAMRALDEAGRKSGQQVEMMRMGIKPSTRPPNFPKLQENLRIAQHADLLTSHETAVRERANKPEAVGIPAPKTGDLNTKPGDPEGFGDPSKDSQQSGEQTTSLFPQMPDINAATKTDTISDTQTTTEEDDSVTKTALVNQDTNAPAATAPATTAPAAAPAVTDQDADSAPVDANKADACDECGGSGICPECKGITSADKGDPCKECDGSGLCKKCKGITKQAEAVCPKCKGTGLFKGTKCNKCGGSKISKGKKDKAPPSTADIEADAAAAHADAAQQHANNAQNAADEADDDGGDDSDEEDDKVAKPKKLKISKKLRIAETDGKFVLTSKGTVLGTHNSLEAAEAQKAAVTSELKAARDGDDWIVRRAHDYTCAAYKTEDVVEAYPTVENGIIATLGPTRTSLVKMLTKSISDGKDAYQVASLGNAIGYLQSFVDSATEDDVVKARAELNDVFKAANPDLSDYPKPSETITPGQYKRPFITSEGQKDTATSGTAPRIPTTTHPIRAEDFTRGPLTDGHQRYLSQKMAAFHDAVTAVRPDLCRMDANGYMAFDRQPDATFMRPPFTHEVPNQESATPTVVPPASISSATKNLEVPSSTLVARTYNEDELQAALNVALKPYIAKVSSLETAYNELAAAPDPNRSALRGVTGLGMQNKLATAQVKKAQRQAARRAKRADKVEHYRELASGPDPEMRIHASNWLAKNA